MQPRFLCHAAQHHLAALVSVAGSLGVGPVFSILLAGLVAGNAAGGSSGRDAVSLSVATWIGSIGEAIALVGPVFLSLWAPQASKSAVIALLGSWVLAIGILLSSATVSVSTGALLATWSIVGGFGRAIALASTWQADLEDPDRSLCCDLFCRRRKKKDKPQLPPSPAPSSSSSDNDAASSSPNADAAAVVEIKRQMTLGKRRKYKCPQVALAFPAIASLGGALGALLFTLIPANVASAGGSNSGWPAALQLFGAAIAICGLVSFAMSLVAGKAVSHPTHTRNGDEQAGQAAASSSTSSEDGNEGPPRVAAATASPSGSSTGTGIAVDGGILLRPNAASPAVPSSSSTSGPDATAAATSASPVTSAALASPAGAVIAERIERISVNSAITGDTGTGSLETTFEVDDEGDDDEGDEEQEDDAEEEGGQEEEDGRERHAAHHGEEDDPSAPAETHAVAVPVLFETTGSSSSSLPPPPISHGSHHRRQQSRFQEEEVAVKIASLPAVVQEEVAGAQMSISSSSRPAGGSCEPTGRPPRPPQSVSSAGLASSLTRQSSAGGFGQAAPLTPAPVAVAVAVPVAATEPSPVSPASPAVGSPSPSAGATPFAAATPRRSLTRGGSVLAAATTPDQRPDGGSASPAVSRSTSVGTRGSRKSAGIARSKSHRDSPRAGSVAAFLVSSPSSGPLAVPVPLTPSSPGDSGGVAKDATIGPDVSSPAPMASRVDGDAPETTSDGKGLCCSCKNRPSAAASDASKGPTPRPLYPFDFALAVLATALFTGGATSLGILLVPYIALFSAAKAGGEGSAGSGTNTPFFTAGCIAISGLFLAVLVGPLMAGFTSLRPLPTLLCMSFLLGGLSLGLPFLNADVGYCGFTLLVFLSAASTDAVYPVLVRLLHQDHYEEERARAERRVIAEERRKAKQARIASQKKKLEKLQHQHQGKAEDDPAEVEHDGKDDEKQYAGALLPPSAVLSTASRAAIGDLLASPFVLLAAPLCYGLAYNNASSLLSLAKLVGPPQASNNPFASAASLTAFAVVFLAAGCLMVLSGFLFALLALSRWIRRTGGCSKAFNLLCCAPCRAWGQTEEEEAAQRAREEAELDAELTSAALTISAALAKMEKINLKTAALRKQQTTQKQQQESGGEAEQEAGADGAAEHNAEGEGDEAGEGEGEGEGEEGPIAVYLGDDGQVYDADGRVLSEEEVEVLRREYALVDDDGRVIELEATQVEIEEEGEEDQQEREGEGSEEKPAQRAGREAATDVGPRTNATPAAAAAAAAATAAQPAVTQASAAAQAAAVPASRPPVFSAPLPSSASRPPPYRPSPQAALATAESPAPPAAPFLVAGAGAGLGRGPSLPAPRAASSASSSSSSPSPSTSASPAASTGGTALLELPRAAGRQLPPLVSTTPSATASAAAHSANGGRGLPAAHHRRVQSAGFPSLTALNNGSMPLASPSSATTAAIPGSVAAGGSPSHKGGSRGLDTSLSASSADVSTRRIDESPSASSSSSSSSSGAGAEGTNVNAAGGSAAGIDIGTGTAADSNQSPPHHHLRSQSAGMVIHLRKDSGRLIADL